ncbi:MAG: hypothetical protein ACJATI_000601 [Halioglobus sp.]|jgi:hypothetical protein
MKNIIYTLIFVCGVFAVNAQTVQATVKKASDGCVTVFAMPSADLDLPPSNFLFAMSVPDQTGTGGTNPNATSVDVLSGMEFDANSPSPYVLNDRYYIDLNFTQDGVPPSLNWVGGQEYPLATICLNGATPDLVEELVQINDLTATGGGNNGFSFWYFETQGGNGDYTNYGAAFYDDGVTATSSNAGDSQAETTETIILPIELTKFTATKGEKSVNLDWSTSSEINGSHFDVQRSQNLSDWATIGRVDAVGESSTLQDYQLVDNNLPLITRSSKTFYYRLNMVDNDGAAELSDVRTVRFNQDGADFIVYPNPSFNEVFVNLSSITTETGPATMNVINMKGERVKEVTLSTNDDISVDVSTLTAGVYYFVVIQGQETFAQKVIKID